MSQFTIDVDAEAVFLDGAWYTREDLSRRIRAMLDAGDFNVAAPSMALQDLTQTLAGVRTMAFRCTPELADALSHLAGRMGQSVSYLVREAVTTFITDATSEPPPPVAVPTPAPMVAVTPTLTAPPPAGPERAVSDTTVRVYQSATGPLTSMTQDDLPKVIVDEQPMVVAGPGALRAAGLTAESPVELTVKKQQASSNTDESVSSEHRWFKQ